MVSQQLLAFINEELKRGVNKEQIMSFLVTQGNNQNDIDTAFSIINSSIQEDEKKPKIIKIIFILFLIIAVMYAIGTGFFLNTIILMQKAYDQPLASGLILVNNKYLGAFPALGLLPIVASLISIVFCYVTLKIKNGSRSSWLLGIISLILLSSTGEILIRLLLEQSFPVPVLTEMSFPTINYNIILTAIAFILIIFYYKKFNYNHAPLSNKMKMFLFSVSSILLAINLIIILPRYIENNGDYGYSEVKKSVNYHVYKPSTLPIDIIPVTKFKANIEIPPNKNGVKIMFDSPLNKKVLGAMGKEIDLTQVGVDGNFDLDRYIKDTYKNSTVNQVVVSKAKNQKASIVILGKKDSIIKILIFVTNDNVLIIISSKDVPENELIQFTEVLN